MVVVVVVPRLYTPTILWSSTSVAIVIHSDQVILLRPCFHRAFWYLQEEERYVVFRCRLSPCVAARAESGDTDVSRRLNT